MSAVTICSDFGYMYMWASLVAQLVKNLSAMQETLVKESDMTEAT